MPPVVETLWTIFSVVGTSEMALTMFGRMPSALARIPLADERVAILRDRAPDPSPGYRHEQKRWRPFPYAALPERVVAQDLAVVGSADRKRYRLWAPGALLGPKTLPFFAVIQLHDEGEVIRLEARYAPFLGIALFLLPALAAVQLLGLVGTSHTLPPPVLGVFTVVVLGWNVASYWAARRAFSRVVASLAGDIQRAAAPRVGPL